MIEPHGGKLINRVLNEAARESALKGAKSLPGVEISNELVKDCKNLARGVYSPLEGFMHEEDFHSVLDNMQLTSGVAWPIPIVLDVPKKKADEFNEGEKIALFDSEKNPVTIMHLEQKYSFSKDEYAEKVYGTKDMEHPGVKKVYEMHDILLAGKLSLIDNTKKTFYDFNLDPTETRILFKELGYNTVVGFQTRNPPHRAHEYLQKSALEIADAIFINPIIGQKKKGDFRDEIILKAYAETIKDYFPAKRVVLSILPARMRYAGPREAVFHAIIRKNFGCSHFVVGRDHAGVGNYYGSYDAQKIFDEVKDLGIVPLKFEHAFYCKKCGTMATSKTCAHSTDDRTNPSGTLIRELVKEKKPVPVEIMRPEVSKILTEAENPFVD